MRVKSVQRCLYLLLTVLLCGCVYQRPVLTTEEMQIVPILPPAVVEAQQEQWIDVEKDACGDAVLDAATHYLRYISFADMRVYEYDNVTLLDGVCTNIYPQTLYGTYEILYYDDAGVRVAHGTLMVGDTSGEIPSGTNIVRAQIDTDVAVTERPYSLQIQETLHP